MKNTLFVGGAGMRRKNVVAARRNKKTLYGGATFRDKERLRGDAPTRAAAASRKTPAFATAKKRGFSIAEAVVAIAIIVLFSGACSVAISVGLRLQERSASVTMLSGEAEEMISAYVYAKDGLSETPPAGQTAADVVIGRVHTRLSLALGMDLTATVSSGKYRAAEGADDAAESDSVTFSAENRTAVFTITDGNTLRLTYTTEKTSLIATWQTDGTYASVEGYLTGKKDPVVQKTYGVTE